MLSVKNLRVNYGRITAVHDVSLEIPAGEIVALVGPNGAGKSTTLSAILGLISPTAGEIRFLGESLVGQGPEKVVRKGISLVPEGRQILTTLTVEENLLLGATPRTDRAAARRDMDELVERFPILKSRFKSSAGTLSGGEQQQLAIARALVSRPKLLMLDEPSLGLSPMMTDVVFDTMEKLHTEGMTILLVEQFAARAVAMADRSYVLRSGRIVLQGSRRDLAGEESLRTAYFGVE